jgi:hypothetical protein
MSLLIIYVVLMITGDFVAYLIGLVIERNAPVASLPAFLAMYFLFLWRLGHRGQDHAAEGAASISRSQRDARASSPSANRGRTARKSAR